MRVLLVYRLNKVKWPNLHKETLDTRNKPEQNKTIKQRVWRRREQSEGGEQCVLTSVNPRLQMERTCESMELLECENSLINDGNCGVKFQLGQVGRRLSHHNTSPSSQNTVFPFQCVHAWVCLFLWPTPPPPTPPPAWIPLSLWWLIYEICTFIMERIARGVGGHTSSVTNVRNRTRDVAASLPDCLENVFTME